MDKSRFRSCTCPIAWPYFHVTHCVVFHPFQSFILPGRLDKVLTFKGTVEAGPFQCDNREVLFHNSCFSKDNSRMVTYFSDELMVWNISSGERERTLDFPVPLLSLSFTASGNYFGTTDENCVFTVYDVSNNFSLVTSAKCFSNARVVEILCACEQNSWFCSVDGRMIQIVKNNLAVEQDSRDIRDIVIPMNLYSSQELECFWEHPQQSWFSKISKYDNAYGYSPYTALRYVNINDNCVLVFSCASNALNVLNTDILRNKEEVAVNQENGVSKISTSGDFLYLKHHYGEGIKICQLDSYQNGSPSYQSLGTHDDFVVVTNGVILFRRDYAPELWNFDLTQCLERFHEIADYSQCLPVSEEVIALWNPGKQRVIFFNVLSKKQEFDMTLTDPIFDVYACSIKHHVLADDGW